jgi:hypothetical protein
VPVCEVDARCDVTDVCSHHAHVGREHLPSASMKRTGKAMGGTPSSASSLSRPSCTVDL